VLGLDERGFVVAVAGDEITIAVDPGNLRWRWTLAITIKEVLAARLRGLQLESHAAAIELGGRAIVLIGPKRAGKSTLSFHLMREHGSSSISNDRVFLGFEDGEAVARGIPSALKVKPPMGDEFPRLLEGLPPRDRHFLYTEAELDGPPMHTSDPLDLTVLSPAQMARRLGVARRAAAPVGTLLFPEVDTGVDGWSLRELDTGEIVRLLQDNVYGASTRPRPATAFELEAGTTGEPPPELAEELGSAVRGLRIGLGRGAYDQSGFPESLLAEIAPWA